MMEVAVALKMPRSLPALGAGVAVIVRREEDMDERSWWLDNQQFYEADHPSASELTTGHNPSPNLLTGVSWVAREPATMWPGQWYLAQF
jgi:hypothetical protein